MTQANQMNVSVTVLICSLLIMGSVFYVANGVKNAIPEIPTYDIPTIDEIQTIVDGAVTTVTVDIPDMPDTFLSLRETLKSDAIVICDDEFDMDDLLDDTNLDNSYDDDEVELVREYTKDRYYSNVNLGIDNSDYKGITVHRVYKIDVDDDYKDKVYVRCEVTSDDDELEADLSYNL